MNPKIVIGLDMSFEAWQAAVTSGDIGAVKVLLDSNQEVADRINECVFPFDSPALFECRQNLEMVDVLLQHGADLNLKTTWWAGGFGILEGIPPNAADPLIERGATVDIWSAVGLGRIDDVCRLLEADPLLVVARGGDGKHPLHYAQSVAVVELLVDAGAEVNARDIDHTSTPVQYLVNEDSVARRLLELGAEADIFVGAALGDATVVNECIAKNPMAADARLGVGEWKNDAGGFIYNWTLGHDMTPHDVARVRNHPDIVQALFEASSIERQFTDSVWNNDLVLADKILVEHPTTLDSLSQDSQQMLARACWWYRPIAVQKMLELGFDPHIAGVHDSTPLDRAAFHGYADLVGMLLEHDSNPPVSRKNEFGGTPLGACIHGFQYGWKTGHPQDHFATIKLLKDAGSQREAGSAPVGDERIDGLLEM